MGVTSPVLGKHLTWICSTELLHPWSQWLVEQWVCDSEPAILGWRNLMRILCKSCWDVPKAQSICKSCHHKKVKMKSNQSKTAEIRHRIKNNNNYTNLCKLLKSVMLKINSTLFTLWVSSPKINVPLKLIWVGFLSHATKVSWLIIHRCPVRTMV